jgi:HSP20 family molecular chaperone IbpA
MWAEACELLDRAERMHRQFFQPAPRSAWQPPVDVFETEHAIVIVVALPGVAPSQVEVRLERGAIIVAGERRLPIGAEAVIHRLELPHGRFERRIDLPPGRFELGRRDLTDGCLVLSLEKLG